MNKTSTAAAILGLCVLILAEDLIPLRQEEFR